MKHKLLIILSSFIILFGLIFVFSYSLLEKKENKANKKVSSNERVLSMRLNGTTSIDYSILSTGFYVLDSVNCDGGSDFKWNTFERSLTLTEFGSSPETCTLDFSSPYLNRVLIDNYEYLGLTKITQTVNSETYDEYRYQGANPNNYVSLNNERWRIIGAVRVTNGTGGYKVKLIREDTLESSYAFNSENSSSTWSEPGSLRVALSDPTNSNSYLRSFLQFSQYFAEVSWSLGNVNDNQTSTNAYIQEHSSSVWSGQPTWNGRMGLANPSDYGFASSSCYNTHTLGTGVTGYDSGDCTSSNWMYYPVGENNVANIYNNQWLMSPSSIQNPNATTLNDTGYVTSLSTTGYVTYDSANAQKYVRPVVYFLDTIKYVSGTGSITEPFIIST